MAGWMVGWLAGWQADWIERDYIVLENRMSCDGKGRESGSFAERILWFVNRDGDKKEERPEETMMVIGMRIQSAVHNYKWLWVGRYMGDGGIFGGLRVVLAQMGASECREESGKDAEEYNTAAKSSGAIKISITLGHDVVSRDGTRAFLWPQFIRVRSVLGHSLCSPPPLKCSAVVMRVDRLH